MAERLQNAVVLLVSMGLSLVGCEAGMRLWGGVPLLEFPDFRLREVVQDTLTGAAEYDPQLGWRQKANLSHPAFHTIDHGIRRNGTQDDHVRRGGVLVVGASFTAGSEVEDGGTWPAQLEALIGQPVINGGEGAYGADQIVLRAEELLPIVAPAVLVIDLVPDNIITAGYSYSGYPKPYFTVTNGQLVLNNSPVPRYVLPERKFSFLKDVLSYSYLIHRVMAAGFPDYWYSSTGSKFERAPNDEVEVTCKLLQRLKETTDQLGIRTLMSVQYGGNYVVDAGRPSAPMVLVEQCAGSMGFQVVDEFDHLKSVLESDPGEFARHYVIQESGLYGHKSVYGNGQVARMVAQALDQPEAQGDGTYSSDETLRAEEVEGSGDNLLEGSERLDSLAAGSKIVSVNAASGDSMPRTFEIAATGGLSEHYGGFSYTSGAAGQYVLSLDVRAKGMSNVRIQLLDSAQNGAYVDFDLDRGRFSTTRLGLSRRNDGGMNLIEDDWYRVWVTARLPEAGGVVIIQLGDSDANRVFTPDGESIAVRAVAVQKGGIPSSYQLAIPTE